MSAGPWVEGLDDSGVVIVERRTAQTIASLGAITKASIANSRLLAAAPVLADAADIVARHDVTAAIAFLLANGESPPGCDGDAPERAYTLEHSYEDDARYTYPARAKLWSAVLSVALRAAGRLP